jgi:hypothetical protein
MRIWGRARIEPSSSSRRFNEGVRKTLAHIDQLTRSEDERDQEAAEDLIEFLAVQLLALIKPFEGKLPDDDDANYYMEREWRVYGHLDFSLDDVRRIYLPERFAREFGRVFPEFYRQVTFSPEPN